MVRLVVLLVSWQGRREESMKFKAEVMLLVVAITLFATAVIFYSYQNAGIEATYLAQSSDLAFPYRTVALLFVGVGSVSMVTASVSYSKKIKEIIK
jgi:hypothetical protein